MFTRRVRVACAVGLCLFTLADVVRAQYSCVTNGGQIAITGYTGTGGVVNIPSTINGYPVTSIGAYSFRYNANLTRVTIPVSVTNIGADSFQGCDKMISVTIPAGVVSIGDSAFMDCSNLSNVVLPSGLISLGPWAFKYCNITSISIPNGLRIIPECAFYSCLKLASVSIPNSVTNIGDRAFADCSISSITIPETVTRIGWGAFYCCYRLTSVAISSNVAYIGDKAFNTGGTSLTAINVDSRNSFYSSANGVLFNKSQTRLMQCPGGMAGDYVIPDSVVTVDDDAFGYCSRLTSVVIPAGITRIGAYTFYSCSSLTNIIIGNNITDIGRYAFYECSALKSLVIGNSVTNIGTEVFTYCSLESVSFRGNAPTFAANVFDDYSCTVYYLPGSSGWGTTFAGCATGLWRPKLLGDKCFGVDASTKQFGFNVTWASGMVVVVESCTNLSNADWVPVQTNTLSNDSFYFSDPGWTNNLSCFYRVRSL